MGQITVFSGPERRRRWSQEERLQILTDAFAPGASVAEVARRYDVSTGLIYTWRSKFREASAEPMPESGFAEARVIVDAGAVCSGPHPAMVIDLVRGQRMRIFAAASPALVTAALKALR